MTKIGGMTIHASLIASGTETEAEREIETEIESGSDGNIVMTVTEISTETETGIVIVIAIAIGIGRESARRIESAIEIVIEAGASRGRRIGIEGRKRNEIVKEKKKGKENVQKTRRKLSNENARKIVKGRERSTMRRKLTPRSRVAIAPLRLHH